jgi:uncharacterized protein YbbC (DUF1343 family)
MNRGPVSLGLNKLKEAVKGKKIALMMNNTALTEAGKSLIDTMHFEWNADIRFLLGMEHGVRGELKGGVKVENAADPVTGLPVVSLYDFPGLKPPSELLATVDAVVFCAQDAGVRHYTYTPWMMFAMERAAPTGTKIIVLDRPNPIGGAVVEGALVKPGYFSIIGGFEYPYRHGMTVGELALMYNDKHKVGCDLTVIPMEGYKRSMWYDQTGLLWIPPSPNIPVLDTLLAYATTGLLQSTNVSFGIGTTVPFNLFGAPWIKGEELAEKINSLNIPGLLCLSKYFIPNYGMYQGEVCSGVYLICLDREIYRPVTAAIHILSLLTRDYKDRFEFTSVRSYDQRAGSSRLREDLINGRDPIDILAEWNDEAKQFMQDRKPYLLYEE